MRIDAYGPFTSYGHNYHSLVRRAEALLCWVIASKPSERWLGLSYGVSNRRADRNGYRPLPACRVR